MWWICPNCDTPVDFQGQMEEVFDPDDMQAEFDPESGLWLHTISCDCGADWIVSIGRMQTDRVYFTKSQ
jgi:hypothetical protein